MGTRQSSYVNTGGIPPARGKYSAAVLSQGYPTPGRDTPSLAGAPHPYQGLPHPISDMGPVEVLWDGDGVPPERTWDQWKYYGMEMGLPPR